MLHMLYSNYNILVCCASIQYRLYFYVHSNGMRVVGKINPYFEKIIQNQKVKMKSETIAQIG